MTALAPVLSIHNLRVRTQNKNATEILKNIHFDIHPGETLCLVGESGSGKSVSSLVVMDLLPHDELEVTSGTIMLGNENILTNSAARNRQLRGADMAMIFQEPMTALNPVLTIGTQMDEVYLAHTNFNASQRYAKALEAFESVNLPSPDRIYASYPHQLSGGQRQRVMIAMALALKPKLLIADEPTTALDVTTQKQILTLIKTLQKEQNTAVLFITHDMGVVVDIADRVCVMRRGEIMETGKTLDILSNPQTSYTKELLRAVPSLLPRDAHETPASPPILKVDTLYKQFSTHTWLDRLLKRPDHSVNAVNNINFSLSRGRTLGIVGESGSGKSTLARCLVRLENPSAGSIYVNGQDIAFLQGSQALEPARKTMQMVFQDPNRSLNPRIPISESIIEGPINAGESRNSALKRAAELLELVGLPANSLERFPHQFSGGQRQRIAIARALIMNPDIIIADEAVSALDVSVQAQVLNLLADIKEKRNLAMLFITHDLRVAAQICDDVLVMQAGKVVEAGPAKDVLTHPSHDYTRSLINAAPGRDWDFIHGRRIEEIA